MERLLAQLEAEGRRKAAQKKERRGKAPSSRKKTADEVWEETTTQAKKMNELRKRIEAGEAAPEEEVFAVAALPDFLVEASPKLKRSRAEAREKVFELLTTGRIPEAYQTYFDLYKTDEFVAEVVVEANRVLQAPGNAISFEDRKVVVRDKNSRILMEVTGVGSAGFHGIDLSGGISAHTTPQVGGSLQFTLAPSRKAFYCSVW